MQDRMEITDLVYRYAQGVDRRDVEAVVSCVSEDATVSLNGGEVRLQGRAALRTYLQELFSPTGALNPAVPSTHIMSNVLVEIDGDRAHVETTAVTYRAEGASVLMRGVHYSDDCIRSGARWQIVRREHRGQWQAEAAGRVLV